MQEKLTEIAEKYRQIDLSLADPDVYGDPAQTTALLREKKKIEPIVEAFAALQTAEQTLQDARSGQKDPDADFAALCREEAAQAETDIARLRETLQTLLLPQDPDDDKNVIIEIRGGVGGEEAALFAASLWRMYSMYAEKNRWKVDVLSVNETELGGIKELSAQIEGDGAYARLKFESGAHRVQRVPDTETQGRVHTSAATVAVLPEAEEVDIEIRTEDLDVTTCRSGGAGGQHVNKTESAIRIVHKPTGIAVECQEERSQHKNRDKAMKVLRAKLYEKKQKEIFDERDENRRAQVGTGDRSGRVRTYNFPQGRLTDHRIGLTLYRLGDVLDGDLDEIIDALHRADNAEKLATTDG